ncbi:MAG: mismatch repair protein [Paenibacillus sp.]|nr:mismatch repair protein [Paenibacillus sp.]
MGQIKVLDEHVANQIAAGEVIERPSSVVKELVENSIDAGSTTIDVTIEEGGLQLIRVADNGSGIASDDCEVAFYRHATSKISSGKDLFSIRTLGFRGEALPSISAIAKVECVTSSQTDGLGRRLLIEGGTVRGLEETASSRGTEMTVRELFYNTPARLKYMKTVQTELGHISDYMYRSAMAHPHIAFSLKHNGGMLLQTLGNGDLVQVIAAVYGTATAKTMLPLQAANADYTISGCISKPEMTRSNRQAMTLVLNGRTIRSFPLSNAILAGYHTLLPINRYPIAAVHIGMDPSLVDVNVHPAKLEVRFSMEKELTAFVEAEVRKLLQGQVLIPAASKPAPKAAVIQERMELYRPTFEAATADPDVYEAAPLPEPPPERSERIKLAPSSAERITQTEAPNPEQPQKTRPTNTATRTDSATASGYYERERKTGLNEEQLASIVSDPANALEKPSVPPFPQLQPIGQMHGTYIVAQNESGLYLIDQHAAHERINYEYYYEKFGRPADASQTLLVPFTLEFTTAAAETLRGKLPLLSQVGVELEPFGGGAFLVRGLPYWFPAGEEKTLIEEMTDWLLAEKKSIDLTKLREKAAIMCSCKASIKANQRLSLAELEALLDRLAACRNPYTCPHGRPIVVSFSTYELEKMFKRVM